MDGIDPSLLTLPTPGERIVGQFNELVEWIKSEAGRDAIETVADLPAEGNEVVDSVGMLDKGLTAVDFAEDAYRRLRGRAETCRWPTRRVAWLKCGLGIGDDVQPIPITPVETAEGGARRAASNARTFR